MGYVKDTKQAKVRVGFDGRVHKFYYGTMARERFENERRVLQYLEKQGCNFVPKVLEADEEKLLLVTTNCGAIVEKISSEKLHHLFNQLEQYGVRHEDAFVRNVTYNRQKGRFCVIDFEFATILPTGEGLQVSQVEEERLRQQRAQIEEDAP